MEIGCGRGIGALLISERFSHCGIVASDYDLAMIEQAQGCLQEPPQWAQGARRENIQLMVADATALPFSDGCLDAVFAFGVLHHIEGWPQAIREIQRVLKPNGVFSFDELFADPLPLRASLGLARRFGMVPDVVIYERDLRGRLVEAGFKLDRFSRWLGVPAGCFVLARKEGQEVSDRVK